MTILWCMAALLTKHYICDFLLQTSNQLRYKGTYGHPAGIIHAFIHAIGSYAALYTQINSPLLLLICLGELLAHYHIDWAKARINHYYQLKPHQGARFWYWFGLDQWCHHITYVLMLFYAAERGAI
jgi:hypothetical protein